MPHQVVKASVHGSVGDLAKITGVVKDLGLNILAIGGGEAVTDDGEVGVISMIIEPDDATTTENLSTQLQSLELDGGRRLANVEVLHHIHLALANEIGALNGAVAAIGNINIRAIISLGDLLGESHVGLGFAEDDVGDGRAETQRRQDQDRPERGRGPSA